MSWYSVRCIFKSRDRPDYEERITLWRAPSFEAAVELAELEAHKYEDIGVFEYVGLAQAFDLRTDRIVSGSEVFSLIRESSLRPAQYLSTFFDTGTEREGTLEH